MERKSRLPVIIETPVGSVKEIFPFGDKTFEKLEDVPFLRGLFPEVEFDGKLVFLREVDVLYRVDLNVSINSTSPAMYPPTSEIYTRGLIELNKKSPEASRDINGMFISNSSLVGRKPLKGLKYPAPNIHLNEEMEVTFCKYVPRQFTLLNYVRDEFGGLVILP